METFVETFSPIDSDRSTVNLRCPICRKRGTFESISTTDLVIQAWDEHSVVGERRCPDPECHALIFFISPEHGELVTFPPETIDFDATDLPDPVLDALRESITCHANGTFKASAMMMRKCLEVMCHERGAEGENLKDRIKALRSKIVLPDDLLDGLDDLRLLGNDAAHVESKDYDEIGREEVEVSLAFTKEVLKATYQYAAMRKQLAALKKSKEGTTSEQAGE
jgi:hypothetical protein